MMIQSKMSKDSLFSFIRRSLFGAVQGVLLVSAFVFAQELRAETKVYNEAIEPGESLVWGCDLLPASDHAVGVRTYSRSAGGNSYTLNLEVLGAVNAEAESHEMCEGQSYTWRNKEYSVADTYVDTLRYVRYPELDSVYFTLVLTTKSGTNSSRDESICQGDSILWGCQWYGASGEYSYTLAGNECSTMTLNLTVLKPDTVLEEVLLKGASVSWRGKTYTKAGEYAYTKDYPEPFGCVDTLFRVRVIRYDSTSMVACYEEEVETWHGKTLTTSNIYRAAASMESTFTGEMVDTAYYVMNFKLASIHLCRLSIRIRYA